MSSVLVIHYFQSLEKLIISYDQSVLHLQYNVLFGHPKRSLKLIYSIWFVMTCKILLLFNFAITYWENVTKCESLVNWKNIVIIFFLTKVYFTCNVFKMNIFDTSWHAIYECYLKLFGRLIRYDANLNVIPWGSQLIMGC